MCTRFQQTYTSSLADVRHSRCESSCVDFDAEHIAVLYDHRTQSEGGATKISGFVQIYARSNGDCLWTCSAVALPAISSLFNLNPLEGDRRSRDNGKSRWSVSSVTPRTSGDHPSPTTHSKLYDVKFDERTASLLLLARNHLYIMLGVKAQCAVALASAHQDDFNFASALTTLCFSPSANRELGEKLAVHDGRAAFVAWVSKSRATQQRTWRRLTLAMFLLFVIIPSRTTS